ncbi:MAG: DUF4166 domain-containing protein [Gammaproteobacteria bacterium]
MAEPPLYRHVLGGRFDALPPEVRAMHNVNDTLVAEGRCDVDAGASSVAKLIAMLFGFPGAGRGIPVRVEMTRVGERERWARTIGAGRFNSELAPARRPYEDLLTERFGITKFFFDLPTDAGGLRMNLRRVESLGVPVPKTLWPRITARETAADGKFTFDVCIELPVVGLLVHYRGWLALMVAAY